MAAELGSPVLRIRFPGGRFESNPNAAEGPADNLSP
jgi:hypothetical protein